MFETREKAQAAVLAGVVFVGEQRVDKPGSAVDVNLEVEVRGNPIPYVSRGGIKLEKALKCFKIDVAGMVCVDIGASTGGFTDCLLKHGAVKVYAVDVGYGQLAWELRQDPRVVVMERTNARYLGRNDIGEPIDMAVIDVSFISIRLIVPALYGIIKDDGKVISLVKPQFEAGRRQVGRKGIVRDAGVHREVLETTIEFMLKKGFFIKGLEYSPVKGPGGNIEFLLYLSKKGSNGEISDAAEIISKIVAQAHENL